MLSARLPPVDTGPGDSLPDFGQMDKVVAQNCVLRQHTEDGGGGGGFPLMDRTALTVFDPWGKNGDHADDTRKSTTSPTSAKGVQLVETTGGDPAGELAQGNLSSPTSDTDLTGETSADETTLGEGENAATDSLSHDSCFYPSPRRESIRSLPLDQQKRDEDCLFESDTGGQPPPSFRPGPVSRQPTVGMVTEEKQEDDVDTETILDTEIEKQSPIQTVATLSPDSTRNRDGGLRTHSSPRSRQLTTGMVTEEGEDHDTETVLDTEIERQSPIQTVATLSPDSTKNREGLSRQRSSANKMVHKVLADAKSEVAEDKDRANDLPSPEEEEFDRSTMNDSEPSLLDMLEDKLSQSSDLEPPVVDEEGEEPEEDAASGGDEDEHSEEEDSESSKPKKKTGCGGGGGGGKRKKKGGGGGGCTIQ